MHFQPTKLFLLSLFLILVSSKSTSIPQFRKIQKYPRRRLDDENLIDISIVSVQVVFSGTKVDSRPTFKVKIIAPYIEEGSFEDSPYLTISGEADRIQYSETLDCGKYAENVDTVECKATKDIYGTYSKINVTTNNLIYEYVAVFENGTNEESSSSTNFTKILDADENEVTGNFFVFYGDYELAAEQITEQILTADNQNVIFNLKKKYSGSIFIFDSDLETKEELECKSYGNKTAVCSGGVVNFGVETELFYINKLHVIATTGIKVTNKYSIAVKTVNFPFTDMSCSSLNLGYVFTATIEDTGITDFNCSEPIEIDLENNSNGLVTSISTTCYIQSDMKTLSCSTNRAGKGGKTYYLQNKSGNDCLKFHNDEYCIYIYNVKNYTTIHPEYVGLDPTKNKDLSYNKEQLSLSDYPKVINVYFREVITKLPTDIKAGDEPLTDCAIGEDGFNFYCNISESTLYGVEDAPSTYKSYEVTFYDVCDNFRRGPTIKVAGMNSDDDEGNDDGDAEPEHDYKNDSSGDLFLQINKVMLLIIGALVTFGF